MKEMMSSLDPKRGQIKEVLHVYQPGSTHMVGDGFPVRHLFPSNDLDRRLSPFLLLDYAGPTYFSPTDEPRGVGEHPHRGFETVTIVCQGTVAHRDSGGNAGAIARAMCRRCAMDDGGVGSRARGEA